MIGLLDYDLQSCHQSSLIPPNLEIMKLATYFKTEKNQFCKLVDLNETDLTSYEKIYFFSESEVPITVPPQFLRASNIIFGGTAFTNKIYQPFEDTIIDYTIPRPFVYKQFLTDKYNNGVKYKTISHVLDDNYYRMYAGDNKLPLIPIRPNKRLFLYDIDFFYPNWEELIDQIIARRPSGIFRIHPIVCHTMNDYFTIRNKQKMSRANEIILDLNINLNEVPYLLKKYKNLLLADIVSTSNIFITLGGNFKSSLQYYKDFIYKINLLYSFWANNIQIKIKYIYPLIGYRDILQPLSLMVDNWSKTLKSKYTLDEYFKRKKDSTDAIIAKNLLLKFYPSAKDLFWQRYDKLVERRLWQI